MKYGLWEDGKRIEWFNEDEVQSINAKRYDYTTCFNTADSHEQVEKNANFARPNGFDDKISEIKKKLAKLRAKTNQNKPKF